MKCQSELNTENVTIDPSPMAKEKQKIDTEIQTK